MSSTAATATIVIIAIALAVLRAFMTACVTVKLSRADGASYPAALLRAGVAFAGTLTLIATPAGVLGGFLL
jgi:hypothetical protein